MQSKTKVLFEHYEVYDRHRLTKLTKVQSKTKVLFKHYEVYDRHRPKKTKGPSQLYKNGKKNKSSI